MTLDIQVPELKKKQSIITQFVDFIIDDLEIKDIPRITIQNGRNGLQTTASYSPKDNVVKVNGKNRALVDVLRSIAHEIKHSHQNESGELQRIYQKYGKIENIGGINKDDNIEDDANAYAGSALKKFSEQHSGAIYESLLEQTTPNKKPSMDAVIKQIISRFKPDNIDFKWLNLYGVFDIYRDQKEEFTTKFVTALTEYLENNYIIPIKIYRQLPEWSDFFDIKPSPQHSKKYILTKKYLLRYALENSPAVEEDIQWGQYILDALDEGTINMLKNYLKVDEISADYLEQEDSELTYILTLCYADSCKINYRYSVFKEIINNIKVLFPESKIKLSGHILTENKLTVEIERKFLFKSESFKNYFMSETVSTIISGFNAESRYYFNQTSSYSFNDYFNDLFFEYFVDDNQQAIKVIKEINGGELPVLDLERIDYRPNLASFNFEAIKDILMYF